MCICVRYGTWNIPEENEEATKKLIQGGYTPLTARVLAARGCQDAAQAQAYLDAHGPLIDPMALEDMAPACRRVRQALAEDQLIAIYGDYDVDGITSTCLMVDFLRSQGGRVISYIPARLEEGYGLNEGAIRLLHQKGVALIITVDCGITATEEAELCRRLGMDLIITDHHRCKQTLPQAVAVIDPHRPDSTYPHTNLSGVGVAFKLAAAICGRQQELLAQYADLLCLGLIADVMPMQGEVRAMVVAGLQAMEAPQRPGLAALMRECGCLGKPVTTTTVGYFLAPRINAAGRMGQTQCALQLFLTKDPDKAAQLAAELCRMNRERQEIEGQIYAEAHKMLEPWNQPQAIVLAGEGWHQGVVGIVASRLSEEYSCPTFLICMSGDKGKASSRSFGGFDLFQSLSKLSPLLESYGGHELAAGFTIARENVPAFQREMVRLAQAHRGTSAKPPLAVDCRVAPGLLTVTNVEGLGQLEPCGSGCPTPVMVVENLTVEHLAEVGGGKHLRLRLRYGSRPGEVLSAIYFSHNAKQAGVSLGQQVDIAFTPQINEYRGARSVSLNVADIRPWRPYRRQEEREQALYRRYVGGRLSPTEAEHLLPSRKEFVAVWRYLTANCQEYTLEEDIFSLGYRIIQATGAPIPLSRTKICLDVFAEQGLIDLQSQDTYHYTISIYHDGRRADLNSSSILCRLRSEAGGK